MEITFYIISFISRWYVLLGIRHDYHFVFSDTYLFPFVILPSKDDHDPCYKLLWRLKESLITTLTLALGSSLKCYFARASRRSLLLCDIYAASPFPLLSIFK